jgi:hypothetical protein
MTSPQCKTMDNESEIILCRGPTQCVDSWPCQSCCRIPISESWLIEEILAHFHEGQRRSRNGELR